MNHISSRSAKQIMKNNLLLGILILLICSSALGQNITLHFDYGNADHTLEYLETDAPNEADGTRFLALEGTRGLMQKNGLNEASMIQSVNSFDNEMQYDYIRENKDEIKAFILKIKAEENSIRERILKTLLKYVPEDADDIEMTVYVVLGGRSSGFSLGDPGKFYIGLQLYKSDLISFTETCKHELFHNLQFISYDLQNASEKLQQINMGQAYAHAIFGYLFREGSAEYIADLRKVDSSQAPHVKELLDHARVNDNRAPEVFYLIERLTLDAYNNPENINYSNIYNLLFDWNWNNPAYYAGYKMTAALTEAYGEEVMLRYLQQDPVYFISDYISLTKEKPETYDLKFSDEFSEMVESLMVQISSFK